MLKLDRRDILAIFIFVILCAFFFWRFLMPNELDRVMFPKGDYTYQFYAWRVYVFRELRAGRLPLWMSCTYSGYPLQADPQSALFYPPGLLINLAAWLVGFREFPFLLLEVEVILHVFLASLFTYLFLRVQVRQRMSALLGGIVFAYGGYLTSYPLLQMAIVEGAIWLPLALLGLWCRYHLGKARYLWLTAFAFGMSILAGHPQTSMFVIYGTLAYQAYLLWRTRRGGFPLVRGLVETAAVLLVAVGLSAVQVLPSWQYMQLSTRASLSVAEAGTGFPLEDIVQFVLTGLVSFWQPLYVGIWPLLLVYVALVIRRKDKDGVFFWFALATGALLFSFGRRLFGFEVGYLLLPGYRLFRSQERLALLISFSLSVLAACGTDTLWSAWKRWERCRIAGAAHFLRSAFALAFLGLLVVIFLHRQGLDPSDSRDLPGHVGMLVLLLAASAGVTYGRLYQGRWRKPLSILALLLTAVDLFSLNRPVNQAPWEHVYQVTPPLRIMLQDGGVFRFQDDSRLVPQVASVYNLQEIGGIAPIRLAHYDRFLKIAHELIRWKLLNVKYVVTWRADLVTREHMLVPAERLYQEGKDKDVLYVFRLRDPGPRAWVVHDVRVAGNVDELYGGYLNLSGFDPLRTAVLLNPVEGLGLMPTSVAGGDQVEITESTPMHMRLVARLTTPGLLVLSEVTYPGWVAYLNGRAVPIHEAYGILRAVALPAGESPVEFRYRPLVFYAGAATSACTWLALLAAVVLSRYPVKYRQG